MISLMISRRAGGRRKKIQNSQNSLMLLQQQQPNFNTNNTLIFSLPFFPQKNVTNNITLISKIQNSEFP